MKSIELITPAYNEQACIEPFYMEVSRVFAEKLPGYRPIITFVDDGSRDKTLENVKALVAGHPETEIRYISFSRNFGKEAAMYAGMCHCVGDYVVMLDVDLQHPPALIPEMLRAVEEEGYDCATAMRTSRKGEPKVKSALSQSFYHVFHQVTALELKPGATDFRLMKRDVAEAIASLKERERFTKGIYSWVGYKNKWIEYENVERTAGKSKWNIRGLLGYSYNGFIAFATAPLRAVIWLGLLITVCDIVWILKILIRFWVFGDAIGNGITTLILITLFLGGVIITILGMIGEYLSRIYMEVKRRPVFITRDTNIRKGVAENSAADYEKTTGI